MPSSVPTAYLLDLDGTLYSGDAAIPGAVAALDRLRRDRVPFRLVTNTTSRSRRMLVARLAGYGLVVGAEEFVTATLAGATLLQEAFDLLLSGAALVALSRDRYFRQGERLALDAGPFVAALEYAANTSAEIAGKPSRAFYAAAVSSLNLPLDRSIAMVGDDLWSDVEGAQRAGLQGWLVRTGKFREEVLQGGSVRPDRVLESVAVLGA